MSKYHIVGNHMSRLIYKSAAARLESFSDNSSFPQIDDMLFIASLEKRGGGGGGGGGYIGFGLSVIPSVGPSIRSFVCHNFFISA